MSAQDYYQAGGGGPQQGYPQYPQQSYGPPQGHYGSPPPGQPHGGGPYGPPQDQYGGGPGGYNQGGYNQGPPPMQYQQQPPSAPRKEGKGSKNCLIACLAGICFCCAVEELCECCFECCECFLC